MASTNGVLGSRAHDNVGDISPQLSAKRKRAESSESLQRMNGIPESKPISVHRDTQQNIVDFIDFLKSHDGSTSILSRELPVRKSSTEPHPKRKKAETETNPSSIIARGESGLYESLEDVMVDIRIACSSALEELNIPNGTARNQFTPIPATAAELDWKVKALRMAAEHTLQVERAHLNRRTHEKLGTETESENSLMNGIHPANTVTQLTAGQGDNKLVLTLYGNAPGAKQLFSSLQQPLKASDGKTDIMLPLREAGLPNGITTTQIVPLQSSGLVEEKKFVPTMGELFANSSSAIPFQPPKPSQTASTRSSTVGWYQPAAVDNGRSSRSSQSYFGQMIASGQWLDYTGALPSVDSKQRQRERALSLGGAKISPMTNSAEQEAAKLEELFRSAYSSFAPVKDDSDAIVPEGLLNRIWWQRSGEKSFERLASNAAKVEAALTSSAPCSSEPVGKTDQADAIVKEESQIQRELQSFAIDPNLEEPKSIQDKDVEEILQEISELLQTLHSYQRIRNISLNPRGSGLGGTSPATDPSKPSEGELATYNTLKSQLSLMIAMLPPYAVAKLNSDQLADLNVSMKIPILTETYKGVMEEDEAAARAKVAEMRAATSSRPTSSVSLHRSSSSLYGNQYSSSSVRPAISGGQQYYPQPQTPVRTPSANLQRPSSTVPTPFPGQRPPSNTPYRPTAYSTPTYPHQVTRPSASQYGPPNPQQYLPTPTVPNYADVPLSVPQQSLSTRYQPSNQAAFQSNRSQTSQNGLDYRYGNGNSSARQTSPQKPQQYNSNLQTGQSQSRPFGTSTPSLAQDHRQFQSSMINGTSSLSTQPLVPQQQISTASLGATGYHTVMTAEQQSTMMERQRAQLAQQQGTQHHARNAAQAGALNVPSGSQVNGGNVVAAGL